MNSHYVKKGSGGVGKEIVNYLLRLGPRTLLYAVRDLDGRYTYGNPGKFGKV